MGWAHSLPPAPYSSLALYPSSVSSLGELTSVFASQWRQLTSRACVPTFELQSLDGLEIWVHMSPFLSPVQREGAIPETPPWDTQHLLSPVSTSLGLQGTQHYCPETLYFERPQIKAYKHSPGPITTALSQTKLLRETGSFHLKHEEWFSNIYLVTLVLGKPTI